jgi:hypothetical protein
MIDPAYQDYCNANYGPEDEPCDHDDYETDYLDGRCRCYRCGESWCATAAEIDAQLRFETEYHEAMDREYRRQWWDDLFYNVRHPLQALHWQMQKRGWLRPRVMTDDDVPF